MMRQRRWAALAVAAFLSFPLVQPSAAQEPRVSASRAELQLSFAPVVKRVAPAVVNVYGLQQVAQRNHPFFDDPFFRRFFGGQGGFGGERAQRSLGSGVIVDPSGIV